jgi:RNA-directed DNA polymerase
MPPCEQMVLLYRMASLADFVQPPSGPKSRIFFCMSIASVRRYLSERLSLKVNEAKSTVDRPWKLKFLGFSFYKRKGDVIGRVATATLHRFRAKIRQLTKRTRQGKLEQVIQGVNQYTMGWIGSFHLSDARSVFEVLDGWVRRRLR